MSADGNIRLLLVDDHTVVRAGYRVLLQDERGIEIVAEADSGEQAYKLYTELQPDIVVMDLSLPGMGGLEATRRIVARDPHARVLIFSMHEDAAFVEQSLAAGARGYITKSSAPESMADAVLTLMRGETYLDRRLAQTLASSARRAELVSQLSAREFDILRMQAQGMNNGQIAERLCLSSKTIANYATRIRRKLRVRSDAELVLLAIRHGLIAPGSG